MENLASPFKEARTFWGDTLWTIPGEYVSELLHRDGRYEPGLTAMVQAHLGPGQVFFDVGAHLGYFSLLAASIVGERGQVHAFEPTPSVFELLQHNVGGKPTIRANQLALWSSERALPFTDCGPLHSAFNSLFTPRLTNPQLQALARQSLTVAATTIDHYVERSGAVPNFIKIDAESAEYEIVRGATSTIERDRPVITIEVGDMDIPGAMSSHQVIRSLLDSNYQVFEFSEGCIRPHRLQDRYSYDNLLFLPE